MWLIVPVILISSLGMLDRRQLLLWIPAATLVLAGLALYDAWRDLDPATSNYKPLQVSGQFVFVATVGFFIAQSLVMAAAGEKQRIAAYTAYFETAWKQFVQLAFRLDFLRKLIHESWFVIPVIAFAFSCAMHITDVRPAIVCGIRTLLLVLMSWILPVAVLVIGNFLLSLPFTGLEPLWSTRSVVLLDLTSDDKPEIVMLGVLPDANVVVVREGEPGQWRAVGTLPSSLAACGPLRRAFIEGRYTMVQPALSDLQIGGSRMAVRPRWEPEIFDCAEPAK